MIHTSIFYSCISPALALIHTDQERAWTRGAWTWNGRAKEEYSETEARFGRQLHKENSIEGKDQETGKIFPFTLLLSSPCKAALIATCKKDQFCLSVALISAVGSCCSHCCPSQSAQREGKANSSTPLMISVTELWVWCFPSLPFQFMLLKVTLLSETCLNTPKGTWKASPTPRKKEITQHCLKQDHSCHSSSQGTCGNFTHTKIPAGLSKWVTSLGALTKITAFLCIKRCSCLR